MSRHLDAPLVLLLATTVQATAAGPPSAGEPPTAQGDADIATVSVDPVGQPEPQTRTAPERKVGIPEIIVTARRVEESLQEVPIAINVLDEQALATQSIKDGYDLSRASPGLSSYEGGFRTTTVYSIRGKGEAFVGSAPGVVPYFADAPMFSPFIYDLSSVQVLKGPQGTLFGKNTTGGAVLMTPKKPTGEFSGYVSGRFGNYSRADKEFAIGGPVLGDALLLRVAGQIVRRGGYTKNLTDGQHLDDEHRESFRASLLATPFEDLENYTIAQIDNVDENGTAAVLSDFVDSPTFAYNAELGPYLEKQRERGPRKVEHDKSQYLRYKSWGIINTTTYQLSDEFDVKNIYRFSKEKIPPIAGGQLDIDGSPFRKLHSVPLSHGPQYRRDDELQLLFDDGERFTGVVGVYWEDTVAQLARTQAELTVVGSPGAGLPPLVPLDIIVTNKIDDTSKAAFVQGGWTFLPDWTITLGFRRTKDDRISWQGAAAGEGAPTNLPIGLPLLAYEKRTLSFTENSWNVALDHRFTETLLGYATVRRGYKAGGFNLTTVADELTYKPEFVDSYEIGVKSDWDLGGIPMRANVDVYYDDYTDIQRLVTSESVTGGFSTRNATAATIYGSDLDLTLAPSDWFELSLQYAYLKTKYDDYVDEDYGDLTKSKFVNSPEHQVMVVPAIHFDLAGRWGHIALQTPIYYQSEYAISALNTPNGNSNNDVSVPGSIKPGYARYDARVDWRNIGGIALSAGLYVRNLTDKEVEVGGQSFMSNPLTGVASTIYNAPRMVQLDLRYDF